METSLVVGSRCPGLLHHSDRGSQYASQAYQALLPCYQKRCSMNRKGNCWDNALVKRVFGSLKRDGLPEQPAATHAIAKVTAIDYLEMFYNSHRRHSTWEYLSSNASKAQAKVVSAECEEE